MAISELKKRKRLPSESIENFAYQIKDFVKFAYSTFIDGIKSTIAKDYLVNGLSDEMQIWLKASPNFSTKTLKEVTELAASYEIAGVKSKMKSEILNVTESTSIQDNITGKSDDSYEDKIVDRVLEKLKRLNINEHEATVDEEVNFFGRNSSRGRGGSRNRTSIGRIANPNFNDRRRRGGANGNINKQTRSYKCRTCQSPDHLFRLCPQRFCQACGGRGHDAWDTTCPNYEL